MTTIVYDDFRLALRARPEGGNVVEAVDAAGRRLAAPFLLPARAVLEREVVAVGRGVRPTAEIPADAATLGRELADALLPGPLGDAYEAARHEARRRDRGLRLTLDLSEAPTLLALPWELMWRPTGFVACQARNPLVRHVGTGAPTLPPPVDRAVRVLAVAASPLDLAPLDVAGEHRRVLEATAGLRAAGRLDLVWLDQPTPTRLHEALRDGWFHVLHVAAHGGTAPGGEDTVVMVDEDGASAPVDTATLRTLLGGQSALRVVVLNSCHGGRTRLADPSSGLATAIVEAGVPAVVAMQFAISDRAAVEFAAVLYDGLIGGQLPLDAAVAEARLRLRLVSPAEFATPVLYVRDPNVSLFHWLVPALGAPVASEVIHAAVEASDGAASSPATAASTGPSGAAPGGARIGRAAKWLLGGAAAAAAAFAVVTLWPEPEPDPPEPAALVGSWEVDAWQFEDGSVQPPDDEFQGLPTWTWDVRPVDDTCTDPSCALALRITWGDSVDEVALETAGSGWRTSIDGATWCEREGLRIDGASVGRLDLGIELDGEGLDVTASYAGEVTPEGARGCPPDGPVVRFVQHGTGRRVGG